MATAVRAAAERAGVAAVAVDARDFYRDASLRFEYGKTDVESFYSGWIDRAALQREVLGPAGRNDGWYLPSLRDRDSNRMTRAPRASLAPDAVVLLTGSFLIHPDLDLDLVVHLSVSRQARRRQVPAESAWTLPAYDRYDIDIDPLAGADVVVRFDDPRHPAVRWSGRGRSVDAGRDVSSAARGRRPTTSR
jgi:hypothetical protein